MKIYHVSVVKLTDALIPDGPCRPDFVIKARLRETCELRTVLVEAMGFDTGNYAVAKAFTHLSMRHLGELVTLVPREVNAAGGKLRAALRL